MSYTRGLYEELEVRSEELKVLRSDVRAFGKVLCNIPLRINYATGDSIIGATDARGSIVLDGKVAQSETLGFYQKADILKGVLLDEAGHNIWLPPTPEDMQCAAADLSVEMGLRYHGQATVEPVLDYTSNLLDDLHNVTTLCKAFPGFRTLHLAAVEHYLGETIQEILGKYEVELAQGKPSLTTTMNALTAATKGEMPVTGVLKKAADMALAVTEMHNTKERLAQSVKLTELIIENALLPPEPPEGNEKGDSEPGDGEPGDGEKGKGSQQKGGGKQEKSEDEGCEQGSGDAQQENGFDDQDKTSQDTGKSEEQEASDMLDKLIEDLKNLPKETANAGMGEPSPIPRSAQDSLGDTVANIEHDGSIEIHRREQGTHSQATLSPHPEREHLALVTRSRIRAIKTKPGYNNPGFRRGELQRRDVHKIATGKPTPFSQPGKPSSPSLNIVLVTDWSGSMAHSGRAQSVLRLIDIMAHAVKRVPNVDLWAMLYTSTDLNNTKLSVVAEPGWIDPNLFGRVTGYRTPTLPALKKAVTLVPPNRPTIIVLLTDGGANLGGSEWHVQQWIQDNRKQYRILSVYIEPGYGQQEYAQDRRNCYVFPGEMGEREITRLISLINREIKRLS